MVESCYLNNAPIKEAVLEIRVNSDANLNTESFLQLQDEIGSSYSDFEPTFVGKVGLNFSNRNIKTDVNQSLIGYKSINRGQNFTVQFQSEKFILSKLTPYSGWNDFVTEGKILWGLYKKYLSRCEITRIGTRFINEVKLQVKEPIDFEHYFTCMPRAPQNMGDAISDFFSRVEVPSKDGKDGAAIILRLGEVNSDTVSVVIDIDAYTREKPSGTEDDIWVRLEKLRDLKNAAFFGSITDKVLEMCK